MRITTLLVAPMLLLLTGGPLGAQAAGPGWWISGGGGAGWSLHRGDDGDTESPAGVAIVSVDRQVVPGLRLGLGWVGSWMEGSFHGESRHHVGLVASVRRWRAPLALRLGLGVGTATVVEIDGPPRDGGVGDVDVGIGDTGGLGGVMGIEAHLPLGGRVRLAPAADVLLQRSAGHVYVTGLLTARILGGLAGG